MNALFTNNKKRVQSYIVYSISVVALTVVQKI